MAKRKPFKPNKYLLSLLKTNSDGYIKQTDVLEESMLIALDFVDDTKVHLMVTLNCTSREFDVASANQIKLKHIKITDGTISAKIKMYTSTATGRLEVVDIKNKKLLLKKERDKKNDTIF
jgi:hypothetical protein